MAKSQRSVVMDKILLVCVDDQPTPIVKLSQACEYAQLLSNFAMEHPLKFPVANVMNMQNFMNKLSKMSISNINKHHHQTNNKFLYS